MRAKIAKILQAGLGPRGFACSFGEAPGARPDDLRGFDPFWEPFSPTRI
jgi:hypothetical protein